MTKEQLTALTVVELKAIAKENGFKGYSKLRKAELIEMLATEAVEANEAVETLEETQKDKENNDVPISASELLKNGKVITWFGTNNSYMPRYYKYSDNTIFYTDEEHGFKWIESSATINDFRYTFDYLSVEVNKFGFHV